MTFVFSLCHQLWKRWSWRTASTLWTMCGPSACSTTCSWTPGTGTACSSWTVRDGSSTWRSPWSASPQPSFTFPVVDPYPFFVVCMLLLWNSLCDCSCCWWHLTWCEVSQMNSCMLLKNEVWWSLNYLMHFGVVGWPAGGGRVTRQHSFHPPTPHNVMFTWGVWIQSLQDGSVVPLLFSISHSVCSLIAIL